MTRTARLAVLIGLAVGHPPPAAAAPPNILFVAVDDLRPQLGCYGEAWMKTPNIDRIAAEGMRFDRHYVQFAVCIPSRAALLTGLRSERTHQVYGPLVWQDTPGARGVGRWFSEQGYRTVSLGKVWHSPDGKNADRFDDADVVRGPDYVLPENAGAGGAEKDARPGPVAEAADVGDDAYRDGKIAVAAVAKLRAAKKDGKPFLLAVGFLKPHLPFCAPKKYWDLYDPAKLPLAPQPRFPEGAPALARNYGIPAYSDVKEGGGPKAEYGEATARRLMHGYAACTSYTDAQVGRVLAELKVLNLDRNTLVVLWGDHGWFLGDLAQWQKHSNFERAARSPLVVRGPGVKPGTVCDRFVETVDVFPTLLDAAGLKPLPVCDGTSFLPLLKDPTAPGKDRAYHVFNRGAVIGYAVRTADARYVEWHKGWGWTPRCWPASSTGTPPPSQMKCGTRPTTRPARKRWPATPPSCAN
ncbi:MAG: iduronate-2-sulfatase [Isosphaera sp.]|nr:iduronate-2-sulfatase [Isosphaera sp.]